MPVFEFDDTSELSGRQQVKAKLLSMAVGETVEFPRTIASRSGKYRESMFTIMDPLQNVRGGWITKRRTGVCAVTRVD